MDMDCTLFVFEEKVMFVEVTVLTYLLPKGDISKAIE